MTTPSCNYLFHYYRTVRKTRRMPMHTHPFCQLHLVVDNRVRLHLTDRTLTILPGSILLLPATMSHSFTYPFGHVDCLSISFAAAEMEEHSLLLYPFSSSPLTRTAWHAFLTLLRTVHGLQTQEKSLIDTLLASTIAELGQLEGSGGDTQSIVARVEAYVHQHRGTRITVTDVAKRLGYSVSYVRSHFRHERGMSVKALIDHERFVHARYMLTFSDLSIGAVAAELDFPDVYAFSRFFKRHQGSSPRAFREASVAGSATNGGG